MTNRGNDKIEMTSDEKLADKVPFGVIPCTPCSSWPGPRTVLLHRTENGFGFTLRHFIVYPPEKVKAEKDAQNSCSAAGKFPGNRNELHQSILEPMDTIFVKQVKEGGAAHRAGLTTGDRIVSVNGETVTGKTYSDVVQLIQKKNTLQLLVVPREDDILQLYFPGTAYRCDVKKNSLETAVQKPSSYSNKEQVFHREPTSESSLSFLDSASGKDNVAFNKTPLQGSLNDQNSCVHPYGESCTAKQSQLLLQQTNMANRKDQYSFPCASEHGGCTRNNSNRVVTSLQTVLPHNQMFGSVSATDHALDFYPERTNRAPVPCNLGFDAGAESNARGYQQDCASRSGNRYGSGLNIDVVQKHNERVLLSVKQKEHFLLSSSHPDNEVSFASCNPTLRSQLFVVPDTLSSSSSASLNSTNATQLSVAHGSSEKQEHRQLQNIEESTDSYDVQRLLNSRETLSSLNDYRSDESLQKERPYLTKVNSVPETSSGFSQGFGYTQTIINSTSSSPKNGTPKCTATARLRKANSLDSNVPSRNHHHHLCENPHVMHLHMVSDRAKLFESGGLETESRNRLDFYRNELCRLTTKCQTPSVSSRAAQFESLSSSQDRLSDEVDEADFPCLVKKKCDVQDIKHGLFPGQSWLAFARHQPADSDSSSHAKGMFSSFPPSKFFVSNKIIEEPKLGNKQEDELPRRKAVRQNSYLQAVQSPYKDAPGVNIVPPAAAMSFITAGTVTNTTVSLTTTNTNTCGTATSPSESHLLCAGIVPERRAFFGDDKPIPSYSLQLKPNGTSMHVCSGDNITLRSEDKQKLDAQNACTHNIQKLKAFFGEKTPQIIEAAEKHRLKDSIVTSSKNIFKEGWLQCKIAIIEGKRSTDRSWKQFWGSLRRTGLHMNKEKPQQYSSNSEVLIHPMTVNVASNYTKRKNVFKVATGNHSEYFLQADDYEDMQDWIHRIRQQNEARASLDSCQLTIQEGTIFSHGLSPQPVQKGLRKLTSFRNRSPTNHSPVIKSRKTVIGEESSFKTKTWKGKMVKTIRKIQGSSTSSLTVPEGVTISIPLEDCPPSSTNEYVPLIVELCTSIVEARGLEMVGIYRVPGNTAAVTSLLDTLNRGFDQLNLQDPRWNDVNVISSVLKAFFRKLPDPLITSDLYPFFIAANRIEDIAQRLCTLKKLLLELPIHHYESIKFITRHLKKVVSYSIINKMEARNLAIVFGPTLIRTADENMATMVTDMSHQCCIVETLINKADWFFENEHNFELPASVLSEPPNSYDGATFSQSILLSNIQKMEEVNAKDIIASIISAANRKVWHKTQKLSVSSSAESESAAGFEERNIDKEVALRSPPQYCHGTTNAVSGSTGRYGAENGQHRWNGQEFQKTSNFQSALERKQNSGFPWLHAENAIVTRSDKIGDEVEFRTYSGLRANTEERIRRFEMETRALLQRDLNRQRLENEQRLMEQRRVEMEWHRAKRDLEQEDPLDLLADNLAAGTRHMRFCSNVSLDNSSNSSDYFGNTTKSSKQETNSGTENCGLRSIAEVQSRLPSYFGNRKARLNFKALERSFFYIDQSMDDEIPFSPELPASSDRTPLKDLDSYRNTRRGGSLESLSDASKSHSSPFANRKNVTHSHAGSSLTSNYFGSLDSLHGVQESVSCPGPEEDDLLCSITSTLDQRFSRLNDGGSMLGAQGQHRQRNVSCTSPLSDEVPSTGVKSNQPTHESNHRYRDPSLHRYGNSKCHSSRKEANSSFCGEKFSSADFNQNRTKSEMELDQAQQLDLLHGKLGQHGSASDGIADERQRHTAAAASNKSCSYVESVSPTSGRNEQVDVQVHRNEHTLIMATVSTTKQTVTSSATTAVITATIVSKQNYSHPKRPAVAAEMCTDKLDHKVPNTSVTDKQPSSEVSSVHRFKERLPSDDSCSSVTSCDRSNATPVHLRRRHTLGGVVDAQDSRSALELVLGGRAAAAAYCKPLDLRLESCRDDTRLQHPAVTPKLQKESLHQSFPSLIPINKSLCS